MAASPRESANARLPLWAYLLMNALVLGACYAVYVFSRYVAATAEPPVISVAIFPVLLVCYLSFTAVQAFDVVFDRLAERESHQQPDREDAPATTGQDRVRKPE